MPEGHKFLDSLNPNANQHSQNISHSMTWEVEVRGFLPAFKNVEKC